jgi:hypothetical protein
MNQPAPARKRRTSTPPELSTQAHDQIMDYLRLADGSTNPAIVEAAIKLANQRQKQQQKSEAKISPLLATLLATFVAIAAVGACWFALVHHPGSLGFELVTVVSSLAILVICLYALFSGHLSQSNFMVVFRWVGERLKQLNPLSWRKKAGVLVASADPKAIQPPRE